MAHDYRRFDNREESLGSLMSELVGDLQDLVRGEIKLAKTEVKEDAQQAGAGIGLMAGAGVMALVCLIFVGLTLMYILAIWMPLWIGALIIAALFLVAGFALFTSGKQRLKRVDLKPRRTLESIKEDAEWAKQQMTSDKN